MNMETNWNYSRILLYRTGIIQTSTYIEVGLWSQLWATAKGGKTIGFIEHGYIKLLAISSNQRRPTRPQSSFISNVYWRSLPSVLWLCWLGDSKGIRPVKKLSGGVLEGTVRHCQSKEASILWSHHEETKELPRERDNARNNARCT